jgi:hypothetical protein
LSPVACGIVQTEFVDHVGEDLCEQRVLKMLDCFPVLKVEVGQGGVVIANRSRDGEGASESERGHRGSHASNHQPDVWLSRPPHMLHSDSDSHLSDLLAWFTANSGTIDRSALTFAQIEGLGWGAFALRDLQVQPFGHHLHHLHLHQRHHLFFLPFASVC